MTVTVGTTIAAITGRSTGATIDTDPGAITTVAAITGGTMVGTIVGATTATGVTTTAASMIAGASADRHCEEARALGRSAIQRFFHS